MRNPNRIFPLYNKLAAAHQALIPDWRFLQFMSNFFGWLQSTKKIDPFFIEDDELDGFLTEFFEDSGLGIYPRLGSPAAGSRARARTEKK